MYEQRFGLNRKPFQSVLSNIDFYESSTYKDVSDSILHALRSDLGVAVLTGPSGIGKTVTLDSFRRALDRDGQAMVLRGGSIQTAGDLLHSLHRRLIPPPGKPSAKSPTPDSQNLERWEILERMQRIADFWGPTIILLDDAHLAGTEVFAELRTLLEEEADGHRLVRLLIAGPISLEETLAEPAMSDFAQRIRAHEFLQPFTSTESVAYLEHQIARVGGETKKIFEPKAIERIVAAADGVPRCIDLLADESLMGANKSEATVVTLKHVDAALGRLRHLPHSWNVSLFGSDEEEPDFVEPVTETRPASAVATTKSTAAGFVADAVRCGITSSTTGIIEIGAASAEPALAANATSAAEIQPSQLVSSIKPNTEIQKPAVQPTGRVTLTSPGVIEIGADIPSAPATQAAPAAVAKASPVAGVAEAPVPVTNSVVEIGDGSDDVGQEISVEEFMADAADGNASADDGPSSPSQPTPATAAPAPRRPVDFDRVFGAVSFAGGAVAVTQEVLGQGKLQSPSASDASENVCQSATASTALGNVSLEHHMVLAGSQESNAEAQEDTNQAADSDHCVAVADPEDPVDANAESSTSMPALDNYQPWQPAGSWVAPTDSTSTRRLYQSPGHADSSPVFDRYTWCELGRNVTSQPTKRMTTIATLTEDAVWPPVVDGIAPTTQIPVLAFDEDYTDLLADLGTLVESTSNTLSERNHQSPSAANRVEQKLDDREERSRSTIDPDQWIDRIDDLIYSDCEDAAVASQTESDDNETTTAESPDNSNSATNPNPGQRLFTLPIDIHEVDLSPPIPFTSGESQSSGSDSDSAGSHDANAELVPQQIEQAHQILECGDAVQENAEEGQVQQAYAPRLLSQARSKIATMGTAVGALKKAAGAESLSDVVETACAATQLELHISECDETDQQPAESSGGFSNLFTRLRQLRKK